MLLRETCGNNDCKTDVAALVVWQGLVSSFKTDMEIFGQWLDLYYLGEAFDL